MKNIDDAIVESTIVHSGSAGTIVESWAKRPSHKMQLRIMRMTRVAGCVAGYAHAAQGKAHDVQEVQRRLCCPEVLYVMMLIVSNELFLV